jgi:hypothetical protein
MKGSAVSQRRNHDEMVPERHKLGRKLVRFWSTLVSAASYMPSESFDVLQLGLALQKHGRVRVLRRDYVHMLYRLRDLTSPLSPLEKFHEARTPALTSLLKRVETVPFAEDLKALFDPIPVLQELTNAFELESSSLRIYQSYSDPSEQADQSIDSECHTW